MMSESPIIFEKFSLGCVMIFDEFKNSCIERFFIVLSVILELFDEFDKEEIFDEEILVIFKGIEEFDIFVLLMLLVKSEEFNVKSIVFVIFCNVEAVLEKLKFSISDNEFVKLFITVKLSSYFDEQSSE